MSSYDWEEMIKKDTPVLDSDFEVFLEECVPELPPEEIVNAVNPWKQAMNRILWGMALTTITFQFWNLDYIFPMIGMLLMLFGFRTLREENKWFKTCWQLMLVRITYFVFICIFDATIYRSMLDELNISIGLIVIVFVITFIQIFCFWKGIRMVQEKAGLPQRAKAAIVLLVWYGIMIFLGITQYAGLLVWGLLIGYICILRSLYKLSKELTEAGYVIEPAQIKVSERKIVVGVLGILIVGISCGYLFFHSYPMDWQPVAAEENAKTEEIKQHLIDIGFPKAILEDLTEEDIWACEGAIRVVTDMNDYPVNEGQVVREESAMGIFYEHTDYDRKELRLTHIAVELPGDRERWKVFHHFEFIFHPGFYGTESLQLWTAYKNHPDAWAPEGDVTGQILYDVDGQTFAASYVSLGEETYKTNGFLTGETQARDVFADFSLPNGGTKHRGYLSYTTAKMQDDVIINSWIFYSHQNSWLQYPVLSATEKRMQDNLAHMEPFKTVHDSLDFYPFRDIMQ